MTGIIILNYNSFECTLRCVQSILKNEKNDNYKIYIVDNASNDDSFCNLQKTYNCFDKVTLLESKKNGGYSYGNNIGIKQAIQDKMDYVVIANPDIYLENEAISILTDALDQNPEVGIAGPALDQPNGVGQFARTYYTFQKSIISKAPFRFFHFWPQKYMRDIEWEGKGDFIFEGTVAGCFFIVRTKDFQTIGLFDEDFFLYNEEDVLAYKMKQINKKCMIVPKAMVFHNHSVTTKKRGMPFIYYYYRISEYLLLCKYVRITILQKIVIYLMNIGWFYFYSLKEKEAKQYFQRLKRIYKYIYKGNYEKANESLYERKNRE